MHIIKKHLMSFKTAILCHFRPIQTIKKHNEIKNHR